MKIDRIFRRVFAPAMVGSLALHALALAAALSGIGSRQATDEVTAIVEFVPAGPAAANAPPLAPDFVPLADESPPPEFKPMEIRLPLPEESPPLDLHPPKASPPPEPRVVSRPTQVAPRQPTAPLAASVGSNWNAHMSSWLAAHRKYPFASLRRAEQGDVSVRFTVSRDGQVMDVTVVAGSGHAELDAAALALLRGATVPAPGAETTGVVRIRYRLTD